MDFIEERPHILDSIHKDQDVLGLKKKALREADKADAAGEAVKAAAFLTAAKVDEERIGLDDKPIPFEMTLGVGRSRMPSKILYLYFLAEQYLGSTTDRIGWDFLSDSETIHAYLIEHGLTRPGKTTIHDNVRCLSEHTLSMIYDAQVEMIKNDGHDLFDKIFIDSTSINGNTEFPTDSRLFFRCSSKLYQLVRTLMKTLGLDFTDQVIERWIKQIKQLDFAINNEMKKKNAAKKRKKHYRKIMKIVDKLIIRLLDDYLKYCKKMEEYHIKPSIEVKLTCLTEEFQTTLNELRTVHECSYKRIFENKPTPSSEKIVSTTDKNAAFIIKGGRDIVIGYKPQIAVSDNMFITSILTPEGNAADSAMFEEIVEDSNARTGTLPSVVSVDDGYSSKETRDKLIESGIGVVSISGSKGKHIIDKDDWDSLDYSAARSDRSKAESIMFSLKHIFGIGQLKRRGIENVRAELLGKVIGYNFYRLALLIRRSKLETAA